MFVYEITEKGEEFLSYFTDWKLVNRNEQVVEGE
jgi:predicted transcriptional regulator